MCEPVDRGIIGNRDDTPNRMSGNKQAEQKSTPDLVFVLAVVVVGLFFGTVIETWWVMAVGVLVMIVAFMCRKRFLAVMAKMPPDFVKMGLLIAWIAVGLVGLALIGWAFRFYYRAGGSYLAIPEIVGFVGLYVAFQGVSNVREITRKSAPK